MNLQHSASLGILLTAVTVLTACGGEDTSTAKNSTSVPIILEDSDNIVSVTQLPENSSDAVSSAVDGATAIPYPLYPNGKKYRVGGENGLEIVLFETTDSFEEVDDFYRNIAQSDEMPRLHAMNDYVRYSTTNDDRDPWATENPGIVIHEFNSDQERDAVGAAKSAKTNIILSY